MDGGRSGPEELRLAGGGGQVKLNLMTSNMPAFVKRGLFTWAALRDGQLPPQTVAGDMPTSGIYEYWRWQGADPGIVPFDWELE